jgi:hypothetical protein
MASKPNQTHKGRIRDRERQAAALELRKSGLHYPEIAKRTGYQNPANCRRAVLAAMNRLTDEPAAEYRKLEIARIDTLAERLWPHALGLEVDEETGEVRQGYPDLDAIDRLIKLGAERRRYVAGLEVAPAPPPPGAGGTINVLVQQLLADPEARELATGLGDRLTGGIEDVSGLPGGGALPGLLAPGGSSGPDSSPSNGGGNGAGR